MVQLKCEKTKTSFKMVKDVFVIYERSVEKILFRRVFSLFQVHLLTQIFLCGKILCSGVNEHTLETERNNMDIVQTFYNQLASDYDKLFFDWQATTKEQALILDKLFKQNGYDETAKILDCACGIGTQAIGLARLGYTVTASDISEAELEEAKQRAKQNHVKLCLKKADFRALDKTFSKPFQIVIAMDNALPHMLTKSDLKHAVESIAKQLLPGGMFVASIRDYDVLLQEKPTYAPPYIHETNEGQRVAFQTWNWDGDCYKLTQYIIEDNENLNVSKFECAYRAVTRQELTELFSKNSCDAVWKFPEETGFYQPILIAKKR